MPLFATANSGIYHRGKEAGPSVRRACFFIDKVSGGGYTVDRQEGRGQLRKEGGPVSISETIALLMLVLAAISLGSQIKK